MGSASIENLPSHLIFEILNSGRLDAIDLVSLELTSKIFGGCHSLYPLKFRSLPDFAAFRLCESRDIYDRIGENSRRELLDRCSGNWKRVLRFLQSIEQSSNMVETYAGKHVQIAAGRYHTMLISDLSAYSCGSSSSGVLGHGPESMIFLSFKRINFASPLRVINISTSYNHSAFIMQSGEVFTCGDNSSICCGLGETEPIVYTPRLVEALNGLPCKQVATGRNFTFFLTRNGRIYTCGTNEFGQLGHGDTINRPIPTIVDVFEEIGSVFQIASGSSYVLAITSCGDAYSFGSGSNFCLGHGQQRNELEPREIETFKRNGIHILSVSAGEEHALALDSNGHVYSWGKGYCGPLGHGDESDTTTPQLINTLKNNLAVQVCAGKRKTFVVVDDGSVYGFGWTGFGSLGFSDRGASEKITTPRILVSLQAHRVCQVSTGLYHTVVVTKERQILGFGDNEKSQLGHHSLRTYPLPTLISIQPESE